MGSVVYTVTAILPDEALREAYIAWLKGGHVEAVIDAGADSALIVRVEEPADPIVVRTRYFFMSRGILDRYLADHAPGLRAEGLRRFGPETGVRFSREIGRAV